MVEVPSLYSLCIKTISAQITNGCEDMQELFELPSDFIDSLITELPPLGLQNLYELLLLSCGMRKLAANDIDNGKKRGRFNNFDIAWKALYKKRWPESIQNDCFNWQQLYWEAHIQNCLDEAAESALLPASDGQIGRITISDSILSSIGYIQDSDQDYSTLSCHCNKFGHYARRLRLHNVLCVAEICELLRASKLQALVIRRIMSRSHVDGVCMLINQNSDSLSSLEFIYCHLSPDSVSQIFSSVYKEGTKIHGIHHLCVKSSFIFERTSTSIPIGLSSFLSSGRSLKSLHFCDTCMGPKLAKLMFDTLMESSCGLVNLEISDNEITGWLSKVDRRSIEFSSILESDVSLKSLAILNLRGNNLCKTDAKDLSNVLFQMPCLRTIDLSDNPIEDDGIRSLIPFFIKSREKTHPISDIKIDNCNLSDSGVSEFLISLPTCKEPLNSLSIADNDLGSSIAPMLAKFLSSSRVRVLNIEDIGLGPLGFRELEDKISGEVELAYINISKNRGGMRTAYFISKLMLHGPNIVFIDAGFNLMPHESLAVIYDALKKLKGKSLEQINLRGNTNLYNSHYTAEILKFQFHRKPIVVLPSLPSTSTPYDDDP